MDLNELQSLHIRELTELAQKLKIEGGIAGLNKQELTVRILEANAKKDGSFSARGVLEVMQDGYGFQPFPDKAFWFEHRSSDCGPNQASKIKRTLLCSIKG